MECTSPWGGSGIIKKINAPVSTDFYINIWTLLSNLVQRDICRKILNVIVETLRTITMNSSGNTLYSTKSWIASYVHD